MNFTILKVYSHISKSIGRKRSYLMAKLGNSSRLHYDDLIANVTTPTMSDRIRTKNGISMLKPAEFLDFWSLLKLFVSSCFERSGFANEECCFNMSQKDWVIADIGASDSGSRILEGSIGTSMDINSAQ